MDILMITVCSSMVVTVYLNHLNLTGIQVCIPRKYHMYSLKQLVSFEICGKTVQFKKSPEGTFTVFVPVVLNPHI